MKGMKKVNILHKEVIPPYFAKITPELTAFPWDKYVDKVKDLKLSNFDKVLLHYDYIFDDLDVIEQIDPDRNLFYMNIYFFEFYKNNFIRRHEKIFGNIETIKHRLFLYIFL